MSDLARQLAAHPRWTWMPGMQPQGHPIRVARVAELDEQIGPPDLDDPATQGCLAQLLTEEREHWTLLKDPTQRPPWRVRTFLPMPSGRWSVTMTSRGATLGEALARALLACWGEP